MQTSPNGGTVESSFDRRSFLKWTGLGAGGAVAVGAAALATWPDDATASVTNHATPHADSTAAAGASPEMTDAEMSKMHEEGVNLFVKNITEPITKGVGATDLPFSIDNGVKVFELTCSEVDWEVAPGQVVKALTYNGIVPGPTIRVNEGDRIRVKVTNNLPESTAVHWHGQRLPNDQDGVPYVTQKPIPPGGSFTYEFDVRSPGSHMYHSHHNSTLQVGKGLLGAFIVTPEDAGSEPQADHDYLYILNDVLGGFTINGKQFPATSAYTAKVGERCRFRFMNEGQLGHPIHIHGLNFEVYARDGFNLPQPYKADTITINPGERWDTIIVADEPGLWAFHCHVLSHAEGPQGMYGMVTVLAVQ